MNKPHIKKLIVLSLILLAAVVIGIRMGSTRLSFAELLSVQNQSILFLRITRIALGIIVGAGLGICGVTLQAILRNPLAEPYLLGTSSGAGLGAVLAIMLGVSGAYLPFIAFSAALVSIVLVYNLAREAGTIPVQSLILSGVIVAMAFSGIIVFLISLSSNEAIHGMMWWLLGNLQVYDIGLLVIVGVIVTIGIGCISILAQDLNAISIGEEEAMHLGINIETIKKILFVVTSLITGAIVSISGMIVIFLFMA